MKNLPADVAELIRTAAQIDDWGPDPRANDAHDMARELAKRYGIDLNPQAKPAAPKLRDSIRKLMGGKS